MNEEEWKQKLTPEQYAVLREKGTEAPFSGALLNEKGEGLYRCAACGQALFASNAKFDSGTGWPSFDDALPGSIQLVEDNSYDMHRLARRTTAEGTEVVCSNCGSHLGHLFNDGQTQNGKRYCINSVCLDLEAKEEAKK